MAEESRPAEPMPVPVDESHIAAAYANFCRVTGTPEELIVDFGLNKQVAGTSPDTIQLTQRIIVNFFTAKRLAAALAMAVARHEQAFGVLETDVQRPNPEPAIEAVRENSHTSLREGIDDVNDVLVSPFTGFSEFKSVWGERFLALLLGVLLYGGGGLMLANFFPKPENTGGDWREATT